LTPAERALRARLGGLTRWAHTSDRTAATKAGRTAFDARFYREVDPDGTLPAAERALRADAARRAYFTRLALKSASSRRKAGEARKRAATAKKRAQEWAQRATAAEAEAQAAEVELASAAESGAA
jgi:hypothetical protein